MSDAEIVAWFDRREGESVRQHFLRCAAGGMVAASRGLRESIELYEEAQRLVREKKGA